MKNMLMQDFKQFNPLEVDEQVARVQDLEGKNKLAELALGQAQREANADIGERNAYASHADPAARLNALAQISPKAYQAEVKFQGEQKKAAGDHAKTGLDIDKGKFELFASRSKWIKQNVAELIPDPNLSYSTVVGRLAAGLQSGVLDNEAVQSALQNLPQTNDPKALKEHLIRQLSSTLSAEQQYQAMMPKVEFKDTGGQIQGIETNPNMPDYLKPKTTLKKTMTPGEIATDDRQRQSNSIKEQEVQILGGKHAFEAEGKMFDDHKGQSKTFIDVRDAYQRLSSALPNATKSAAATLAGATTFMKLLDPGSVVRESELGMAMQATGALDRATNYFNVLQNGKVLTASQAKDFQNIADQLYKAAEQSQGQIDGEYTDRAGRYGLNPKNIVGDYKVKKPAASTSSGGNRPSLDTFFKR